MSEIAFFHLTLAGKFNSKAFLSEKFLVIAYIYRLHFINTESTHNNSYSDTIEPLWIWNYRVQVEFRSLLGRCLIFLLNCRRCESN